MARYDGYDDCFLSNVQWDIPFETENKDVQEQVSEQFRLVCWKFRVKDFGCMRQDVASTHYTLISPDQEQLIRTGKEFVKDLEGRVRVGVPLDKDGRR